MDSRWLKGIPSEHVDDRKKQFAGFKTAFAELDKLLEGMVKEPAFRDYTEPNWALKQMSINEYNQVLKDIRTILKE